MPPEEASSKPTAKVRESTELKSINVLGKVVGLSVIIWLISISYYAFLFFLISMIPAWVFLIIDKGAGRFASKTVTAMNFIGVMPYLFDIALTYESSIAAKELMENWMTWLNIFSFATMGWAMIWVFPRVTLLIFTVRAEIKTNRLLEIQQKLEEEWGEKVKGGK